MAVDAILSATKRLFSSMGNAQEIVRQAKILAEATSSGVNAIKLEAENETDRGVWVWHVGVACRCGMWVWRVGVACRCGMWV